MYFRQIDIQFDRQIDRYIDAGGTKFLMNMTTFSGTPVNQMDR